MLRVAESERAPAPGLLDHPWLRDAAAGGRGGGLGALVGANASEETQVSPRAIIANFQRFHGMRRFKKLALTAIATQTGSCAEIAELQRTFAALDKNSDGKLSLDEIRAGCRDHAIALPENFAAVFAALDTDASGALDYTEFIAGGVWWGVCCFLG